MSHFLGVTQPEVSKILNGKVDLSYQAIVKILWVIDPDQSVDVFFPRCKVRKRGSSKQNPIPPSEDDKTFPIRRVEARRLADGDEVRAEGDPS